MIDFHNKALFPTSLEISLHPIYSALVRPYLEYGIPTCSPHLIADINHLEEIQKLALRLITGIRTDRQVTPEDRIGLFGEVRDILE